MSRWYHDLGMEVTQMFWTLLIIFALTVPVILTVWNVVNCFVDKPKMERTVALFTMIVGALLYILFLKTVFDVSGDWDEVIFYWQKHVPIAYHYRPTFILLLIPGMFGYPILLYNSGDSTPPLTSALCTAGVILMNLTGFALFCQLFKNAVNTPLSVFLILYHLNVLFLSTRVVVRHLREQIEYYREREDEIKKRKGLYILYIHVTRLSQYAFPVLMCLFFTVAILEIIFVLLGQGVDAPVKMFTDTADWTFSQQIPPPPADFDGHYLCTVAAGGHKKIVKPTRLGRRRGAIIVVNRQLCIANAFEDVIQERFPRFHKKIRHFYDTHGYPLSRLITNERRADIVYFLMKPLEWIFLIFLYLVDRRPEERIERQYSL